MRFPEICGLFSKTCQELSVAIENAVGNEGMGVRVEVRAEAAEGLQGDDAARADVTAVKECLEGFQNRGVAV